MYNNQNIKDKVYNSKCIWKVCCGLCSIKEFKESINSYCAIDSNNCGIKAKYNVEKVEGYNRQNICFENPAMGYSFS